MRFQRRANVKSGLTNCPSSSGISIILFFFIDANRRLNRVSRHGTWIRAHCASCHRFLSANYGAYIANNSVVHAQNLPNDRESVWNPQENAQRYRTEADRSNRVLFCCVSTRKCKRWYIWNLRADVRLCWFSPTRDASLSFYNYNSMKYLKWNLRH